MKILFAAQEDAWGGFLQKIRELLPEHEFVAQGRFEIPSLAGFDILIPTMSTVDDALLASADRLKLIQQCGSGLETVDIDAATRRGIPVANVPAGASGNADSVAELAIYLMIGLSRNVEKMNHSLRNRVVGGPMGTALQHRTVGIVGLGGIGKALVHRLKPFGVRLLGLKRSEPQRAQRDLDIAWVGAAQELPTLLAQSDYVVLALPVNRENAGLMNAATFDLMRPSAFLINVSRGGLVDYEALKSALKSGRLAGAGLDVFWEEPPDPHDEVFRYNVLATPHVGGATDVSVRGIARAVADNINRVATGQPLLYRHG